MEGHDAILILDLGRYLLFFSTELLPLICVYKEQARIIAVLIFNYAC